MFTSSMITPIIYKQNKNVYVPVQSQGRSWLLDWGLPAGDSSEHAQDLQ